MENKLNELRQGLTQYVFQYYKEIEGLEGTEEAKRHVRSTVSSLLQPFTGGPLEKESLFSLLEDWQTHWLKEELVAIKQKDYETQDKAITILNALKVLLPYAKERDESNGFQ